MIQLSKRLFCAIEAVVFIAYSANGAPVSGKELAERQRMPSRYLEQMMQKLVRAGILRGLRGPRGGYLLAKEKRVITLADICTAVEEPESSLVATALANQVVMPVVQSLRQVYHDYLSGITLAGLCDKASALQIAKDDNNTHDFII